MSKGMATAGPNNDGEPMSGGPARHRLTVISGPSGVGKSSIVAELRRLCPDIFYSVSVTTRRQRPGEIDGEHYHFVDRPEFDAMLAAGALLECDEFAGNCYGTPREPVEKALMDGRPAILEITLNGA